MVRFLKILLIGNSFVIRNKLGRLLQSFDETQLRVGTCAAGSMTWESHIINAPRCLSSDSWDVVVLQEQSRIMTHPKYSDNDGVGLVEMVRNFTGSGVKVMLMETWAYRNGVSWWDRNQMQSMLQESYIRISDKTDTIPVLVGDAVVYTADKYGIEMWDWDGQHPSLSTTQMAACMLFKTITNKNCPLKGLIGEISRNITI